METMRTPQTQPIRLACWLLLVGCLTMIFTFSTQDGEASGSLSTQVTQVLVRTFSNVDIPENSAQFASLHHLVRKLAHATVYCTLALCCAALAHTYPLPAGARYLTSGALCLLCATADECQQLMRAGRSGAFTDVLIDMGGAVAGLLIFFLLRRLTLGASK